MTDMIMVCETDAAFRARTQRDRIGRDSELRGQELRADRGVALALRRKR